MVLIWRKNLCGTFFKQPTTATITEHCGSARALQIFAYFSAVLRKPVTWNDHILRSFPGGLEPRRLLFELNCLANSVVNYTLRNIHYEIWPNWKMDLKKQRIFSPDKKFTACVYRSILVMRDWLILFSVKRECIHDRTYTTGDLKVLRDPWRNLNSWRSSVTVFWVTFTIDKITFKLRETWK